MDHVNSGFGGYENESYDIEDGDDVYEVFDEDSTDMHAGVDVGFDDFTEEEHIAATIIQCMVSKLYFNYLRSDL